MTFIYIYIYIYICTVARKRKLTDENIQAAKKKKGEVTKCIEVLKTEADKLSIEAEERAILDIFIKANSFRKTILEKLIISKVKHDYFFDKKFLLLIPHAFPRIS